MNLIAGVTNFIASIGCVQWVILFGIFLVSYNYVAKEFWRNLPPGPPCLPIVGSLPFLSADIREPLMKMADKYGDVFTIYLGPRRVVILNGYEAVSDAFAKSGHAFSGRPDIFFIKYLAEGFGVVSSQGEFWKVQRRHTLHVLKDFGMGRSILEERILEEVGFFLDEAQKNTKKPFNPQKLITTSVANVICSVAFGRRMEYDNHNFNEYIRMLNESFKILGSNGLLTLFPFLRHLPGDIFQYKKVIKYKEYTDRVLYQVWIDEHKDEVDEGKEATDFIGAYLKVMNKEQSENKETTSFSEYQLKRTIADLFAAGTETTSTTLAWAVIHMTLNPDLQTKVQQEIDAVVEPDELPRMHHRNQLPFTEACIQEIQRISDIVPLGVPHATTGDVHFKGYLIPTGTMVMANMYSVHYDPKVWPEPEKFDPSRFIDADGNIIRREELIPFSTGKRICVGEGLARMELFLYFASMMHRFRFLPAEGHPLPDTTGIVSISHMPKPFNITIESRQD